MGPEPKIKDVDKLKDCYLKRMMSTKQIAADSEALFGVKVHWDTVRQTLIRNGVPIRSLSESTSIAMATLDRNISFLDGKTDWIDGFLLGDGCISFRHGDYMGARFTMGSSCKRWVEYAMSGLSDYGNVNPKLAVEAGANERNPNDCWQSRTLTHPDIVAQARRWYPDGTKHVPQDVVVSPCSLLLWYLGDGSFHYTPEGNMSLLRLATCAFAPGEVEGILIPKLGALGIEATRHKCKNDIYVRAPSIRRFFSVVGTKSPFPEYARKFEVPEWLFLNRMSDFITDRKARYMAYYYVRTGKAEFTRSPGGRMCMFTDGQRDRLLELLGTGQATGTQGELS